MAGNKPPINPINNAQASPKPRSTGVTVNAVCPGYTETDILRDSIASLLDALHRRNHIPQSSPSVVERDAVAVYVERREFDSAIELLGSVVQRLRAWSDSAGTRHLALDVVDRRLHEVLALCAEAAASRTQRARSTSCRVAW